MAFARQHGDRGLGIVGARSRGDLAIARAADERAAGQRAADRAGIVLRVPAVAQDRERNAGGLQLGFRRTMLVARSSGEVSAWRRLV